MEIIHTVAIQFFALAGIVLGAAGFLMKAQHSLKKDLLDLRTEIKEDMRRMEDNFSDLRKEVYSLGQRLAKLEGLFLPTPERVRPPKSA